MRTYNKVAITAAFTEISRLERENKSVVMYKLDGLNSQSRVILKEVLTHSFNFKNHGFTLDKIFSIDKEGKWHRQSTPNNPKDEKLIDIIIKAMTYVSLERIARREHKKTEFKKSNPSQLTDEFLISELKTRGYFVFKQL